MNALFNQHLHRFISLISIGMTLLMLTSCSSSTLLTREDKPDKVVLSSFQLRLWHFDGTHFNSGNYASFPVALRDPNASSADLDQIHRIFNGKENASIKKQLEDVYAVIQTSLKHTRITLLPADYLAKHQANTTIDPYGFPQSKNDQNAAKLTGASMRIILYLDTDRFDVNNIAPGRMQVNYSPKLTVNLIMTNAHGKVIWNDSQITQAIRMTQIDEQTSGGETLSIQQESSLQDMVRRALETMLNKLPFAKTQISA